MSHPHLKLGYFQFLDETYRWIKCLTPNALRYTKKEGNITAKD